MTFRIKPNLTETRQRSQDIRTAVDIKIAEMPIEMLHPQDFVLFFPTVHSGTAFD